MTIQEDGQQTDAGQVETGADLNQVNDPDMQSLIEAEKAAEAEEAAAAAAAAEAGKAEEQRLADEKAKQEKEAAEAAENVTALPPASQTQPTRQAPTSVPTDRFNQVIAERNSEREARIAAEAKLTLLSDLVKTGQMTPELADSIREGRAEMPAEHQDPFAEIDAAELALAEKYDKNEISTVQWTQERQKLERQKDDIRAGIQQSRERDTFESTVATTTRAIEADFPILKEISQPDLEPLKGTAHVLAMRKISAKAGFKVAFNPRNAEHVLQYRYELANEANRVYGDGLGPLSKRTQKPAAGAQPGNGQQPPANGAQPAAKPTAAQVKDKLALQSQHPPQTPTVRNAGASPTMSDVAKRVETMNTEELEAFDKANPGVLDQL